MSASDSPQPHRYVAATYPAYAVPGETARIDVSDRDDRIAWWLALIAAVLGMVLGIVMVVWPDATLQVVAVLFGGWLLLHGLARIVQAITGTALQGAERVVFGVVGLFFVVAGVIALRDLLASLTLVVTLIGLMWLIGGIVELISAFGGSGRYRWWHVTLGVLSFVAALIVLIWPQLSLTALVYVTGAWLIVMGLIRIALVVQAGRTPAVAQG